jgi:predicted phage-related endonuclease
MSIKDMELKARELRELKLMAEELDAEITAIEEALKSAVGDSEQVIAGEYKITYKPVTTSRIDTKRFKAAHPDIAALYTVTNTYRRFQVV